MMMIMMMIMITVIKRSRSTIADAEHGARIKMQLLHIGYNFIVGSSTLKLILEE
jgi:hypothetical protein